MWAADLPNDGGLIYSGSEAMMSDFIAKFADSVLPDTVKPLYLGSLQETEFIAR
jgi:accessory colonization factor AcfC